MAYSGKTYTLPSIHNFAQAHAHFINTKPVRARKHTNIWTPDTRPLKNSGATHYRLRRGIDRNTGRLFFDLVLYSTTMARYHEPVNGKETRFYHWHSSVTSKGFMWDVAGVSWRMNIKDTEGVERAVPIGHKGVRDDVDLHEFGCKVVLQDGKLVVSESDHQPLAKRVANTDDRERVAVTKERIETLLDVAALRIDTFAQECEINQARGRAFGGKRSYHYNSTLIRRLVDVTVPVEEAMAQDAIEAFMHYAQECYNVLASKRSVAMANAQNTSSYWRSSRPATDDPYALDNPITVADLRKSLTNNLLQDFGVKRQSERVPLPKFMAAEDFPRSNRFYY